MTYEEVLAAARTCVGPHCKACPVCNGLACRNTVPGPGAKGLGTGAIRNYQKWQEVLVNLDTICENKPVDLSAALLGRQFSAPIFAAPIGALKLHYGDKHDDLSYNNILVPTCAGEGIAAFTGDGTDPRVFEGACAAIRGSGGAGIPTVKPWDRDTLLRKLEMAKAAGAAAIAMDIDAAGLPFLQNLTPPAGSKTVEELREVAAACGDLPFILKGIMTVRGAEKAAAAGAKAIVVSNHGGRVLDQCPRHGGGAAHHRRRGGEGPHRPGGRGHPHGDGRVQGPGPGGPRGAHRPALCPRPLRRRGGGGGPLHPAAEGGAGGHHGHVRRPQPPGDQP